jgi:hypothetical protein
MRGLRGTVRGRFGRFGRGAAGTVLAAVATLAAGAATAHAAATPVAIWNLDDPAGSTTMTDTSGLHHDGTLTNVTAGVPGFDTGTAFDFASIPSYVSVPSATDLNPETSPFKVALRIKFGARPTAAVGDFDVIRKGLSTTAGGSWKIEILETGRALCNYRAPSLQGQLSAGPNLADGNWHAITCARTATKVTLTVDGKAYSKKVAVPAVSNVSEVLVGAKNTIGGDQTTATIDDVTITKG